MEGICIVISKRFGQFALENDFPVLGDKQQSYVLNQLQFQEQGIECSRDTLI